MHEGVVLGLRPSSKLHRLARRCRCEFMFSKEEPRGMMEHIQRLAVNEGFHNHDCPCGSLLRRLLPRVVHVGGGTGEASEGTTSHPEKKMTEEGVCTALLQ